MDPSKRISSGLQRIIISLSVLLPITFAFCYLGYKLIILGATGEWEILAQFEDYSLYITSLAPGIFFCLTGAVMFVRALKYIKNFN